MLSSLLFSCAENKPVDILILFMEQEKGVEPYQTRMIMNQQYLRIDDGTNSDSFVLYDRVKKVVYSTNPDEKRIMAIHEKSLKKGKTFEPPFKLSHSIKELPLMKDAPMINGEKAKRYKFITNNKTCYDVIAVKKLMPKAVKMLSDFYVHMATDSVITFNNMPADVQEACDMTMSTFKPTRHLEMGFPIQEWGKNEYMRSLVDYNANYKADSKLFELPKGYHNYTVNDLREGKVKFDK